MGWPKKRRIAESGGGCRFGPVSERGPGVSASAEPRRAKDSCCLAFGKQLAYYQEPCGADRKRDRQRAVWLVCARRVRSVLAKGSETEGAVIGLIIWLRSYSICGG